MAPPRAKHASNNKLNKIESKKPAVSQQKKQRAPLAPPGKKTQEDISSIPQDLQQLLLNIFRNSFQERLNADIGPLLQEIKGHLYNRDFHTAFGKTSYLEAYAARWSPSRALGYLQVLDDLSPYILPPTAGLTDPDFPPRRKIVCLGGGAGAEVVALGGFLNHLQRTSPHLSDLKFEILALDMANWSSIITTMHQNIISEPPISKYASATAKALNKPLIPSDALTIDFHQSDILHTPFTELAPHFQSADLVTLMFTLNELYTTSLALTQAFLLNLTECVGRGALLLVVDSPGSYSSVLLGGREKRYPMQWLVDHVLLGGWEETSGQAGKEGRDGEEGREGKKGRSESKPLWTKLREEESRWFRLSGKCEYPIELENMRFQLHVYRRN